MSDNTFHALAPGTRLQGQYYCYSIIKVLGQGTFGITYLASNIVGDDEVEQMFCIKEFFMHDINGREGTGVTTGNSGGMFDHYRRKFEQESSHLGQLHHENIVMVTDTFRANATSYYVMQYIDGMSLDDYIAVRGRLGLGEATSIARQIGAALECMHSKGMLHLDVKPSNVMMGGDGRAVLIDFGLSKQYDGNGMPESSTTVGSGTPGYAPIEQASHRDGQGFPVQMDEYALGATVLKMLTGERPPEASEILNDGFPSDGLAGAGIPPAVAKVIEKAMSPQRSMRYPTVAAFVAALGKAATAVPHTPQEATVPDEPETPGDERDDERPAQAAAAHASSLLSRIAAWAGCFVLISLVSNLFDWIRRGSGNAIVETAINRGFEGMIQSDLLVVVIFSVLSAVAGCWIVHLRWKGPLGFRQTRDCRVMLVSCIAANVLLSLMIKTVTDPTAVFFLLFQETLCVITTWMFMTKKN